MARARACYIAGIVDAGCRAMRCAAIDRRQNSEIFYTVFRRRWGRRARAWTSVRRGCWRRRRMTGIRRNNWNDFFSASDIRRTADRLWAGRDWTAWSFANARHCCSSSPRAGLIGRHRESLFVGSILSHFGGMNREVLIVTTTNINDAWRIVDHVKGNIVSNPLHERDYCHRSFLIAKQISIWRRNTNAEILKCTAGFFALFDVLELSWP